MIDTVIVSGGNIETDFALDFLEKIIKKTGREKLCLIAADKGMEFFMKTGINPDIVVGDFDSLSQEGIEYLEKADGMEIIRLKPEKDDSDTQSALRLAADKGREGVFLIGATGTRLDHVMANLELMIFGRELGIEVSIIDSCNYVTLVKSGTVLTKEEQFGRYVSFFPLGGEVSGLTLEGFKYPLNRYCLTVSDCGLTVSNEMKEETARVTFESGNLMMIMSRD